MSYEFWQRGEMPLAPGFRFALRLRMMRAAAGLSAAALAERAGMPLIRYMALESGSASLTVVSLSKVADALTLTPDVFFDPD
jgi:transcriptional regulator with XRE-family HTH domain